MSSTNRTNARDSHISDYYITPTNEIDKFLEKLFEFEPQLLKGKVLDPCSGGDEKHQMSYPKALSKFNIIPKTIDIRADSLAEIKADYLKTKVNGYDLIITNPPFSIAIDIIKKAISEVNEDGFVVMLLRLNFFGSKQRLEFWKENMPQYCFVHHIRMSFTDNKVTDSIEYCHMCWHKGYKEKYTRLFII